MTTNVRDSIHHVLAADSRWSIDLQPFGINSVLYVDDVDYQKIIAIGSGAFLFAGNSKLISDWKNAIALAYRYPNAVQWDAMPTTGLAVCGVERTTGRVMIEINQSYRQDACSFAGSGAHPASICWSQNQDAERAVETARAADIYTGGQVRYYRLTQGASNAGVDRPLSTLNASFLQKGYVMHIHQPTYSQPTPISEAVTSDPALRSVMDEVAKGNITATAPHLHMNRIWSTEEKQELVKAMEFFFPKSS